MEPQPDITTHTHGFELISIIAVYFGIAFGCAIIPVGIALDILFHIKSTLEGWCHVLSVSLVLAVAYAAYQLYKMLSEENHKNKGIQEKNAQKEREYQNQINYLETEYKWGFNMQSSNGFLYSENDNEQFTENEWFCFDLDYDGVGYFAEYYLTDNSSEYDANTLEVQ